jgi:hypothetical protein
VQILYDENQFSLVFRFCYVISTYIPAVLMPCSPSRSLYVMYMRVPPALSLSQRQYIVRKLLDATAVSSHFLSDADIVCSRAKNHYDPQLGLNLSETATNLDSAQAETSLVNYKRNFRPLHQDQKKRMYFSVCIFRCLA